METNPVFLNDKVAFHQNAKPPKKKKEERQNNFKRQMVIWSNSIVLMPLDLKGVI